MAEIAASRGITTEEIPNHLGLRFPGMSRLAFPQLLVEIEATAVAA